MTICGLYDVRNMLRSYVWRVHIWVEAWRYVFEMSKSIHILVVLQIR